jgi:hypothetical protein
MDRAGWLEFAVTLRIAAVEACFTHISLMFHAQITGYSIRVINAMTHNFNTFFISLIVGLSFFVGSTNLPTSCFLNIENGGIGAYRLGSSSKNLFEPIKLLDIWRIRCEHRN